jgi:hypothetical protein
MTHASKKQVIKNYQITVFSVADTKTHKKRIFLFSASEQAQPLASSSEFH